MEKKRTLAQNGSMHQYFDDVAKELEAQGITRRTIVEDLGEAGIPVTEKYVKEVIWQHFMVGMYGTTKTSELTTAQLTEVEKVVTLHLIDKYEIDVEWWSSDNNNFNETYSQ
jgi:dTDP-4-amino-4,6-dideoxygalactose transaminase